MAKIALHIYYKDANGNRQTRCVANAWTWQDNAMGERYLTLTINSDKPVFFAVGDYCEYRGETYTLNYIPSETQSAKMGRHGTGFTYENIKFDSVLEELTRCAMLDITPTTGDYIAYEGTNYTGSAVFTLFCGSATVTIQGVTKTLTPVTVLAGKIQANLDRMFPSAGWQVIVDYEHTHTDEFLLSFDNWTASQALSEVYNTFKLNYIVKGRQIRIGFEADNVTGDEMFAFGFGKGYNTEGDDGKGLFEIQKMSDSSQKIVTRLRALGSTKNMPYRYYNKKYNLPQAMFPLNLQLPDTFETPEVKAAHNAQRESSLRHVLGDTNDAYIDKNDNAAECVEGVREDVARWDGSDSNLKEIFPTIKEGTYRDLKNALVPDAQGRTAGSSYYNGYGDTERIDEVLAVGYDDGGIWVDDANIGDGIVPEANVSGKTKDSPTIEQNTTIVRNTNLESRNGKLYGAETELWRIESQNRGAYILVDNNNLYFRAGSFISGSSFAILRAGFIIRIKINDGNSVTTLTYESAATDVPNGGFVDIPFPRLPDVKNVDNTQISRIALASTSDVSVTFTPYWVNDASLPANFEVSYKWGKGEGTTTDAHLVWSPDDSTFGTVNQQFHIYVKDLGFNINDYKSGEAPNVVMAGGVCVSRSFEITDVKLVSYTRGGKTLDAYCLTLNRATDDTIHAYFPSQYYPIQAGDNFVLEGIEMPDVYVQLAELRLLRAATDYLADNCDTSFIYKPTISNIYLQWNYDKMLAAGTPEKSIYWRLYAGLKFTFRGIPESLNPLDPLPIAEITIESVTIREGEKPIPQVEITLNNNIQQNTIQKLTTTVDRIYSAMANGVGGTGAAATNSMLLNLLRTEGRKLFLSKVSDDTASGVISFLRGALFGEGSAWGYVKQVAGEVRSWFKNLATDILTVTTCIKGNNGLLTVDDNLYGTGDFTADGDILAHGDIHSDTEVSAPNGTFDNVNVSDTITTKNLEVTGLAHFFELVIDKIRSAGGAQIYTPAEGFKVEAVNKFVYDGTKRCRLWWRATDGTVTTENMWEAGDQAICMNFNDIFNGGGQGVSNKYFWSVVAYKATVENGTPDWDSTNPAWREGAENPYERTRWHYIDIFSGSTGEVPIDYLGSPAWEGAPWAVEAGDDVAMLGHRGNDVARQSALYLAAYKTIDKGYVVGGVTLKRALVPPHIAYYEGINDFNLGKHRTTFKDRLGGEWWGEMKVLVNGGYQSLDDYVASKLELTEEHFLTEISKLPISRNLLLNTDYTSIEAALPTYWDVWGTVIDLQNVSVAGQRWKAMLIWPGGQYSGIMQESKVLSDGEWKKVLKHGGTYTLSFWAKTESGAGTSRADVIFHVLRVYDDGWVNAVGAQPFKEIELTHDWQRAAVQFTVNPSGTDADLDGYAFRVMVGCMHDNPPHDERILVSRVQLEESVPKTNPQADDLTTATDWHRGEENAELLSSQIEQTAEKISMAVFVDGVERSGLRLDGDGVSIRGDKLQITGAIENEVTIEGANLHILNDLDLQGLTTENVTAVERNPRYPTIINMGIGASNPGEVVKSVQVKGNMTNDDSQNPQYGTHMVVLPFYDAIVGNETGTEYWPTQQTEIDFDPDDNTFLLHDVASVPLSQRKVVQWKKNGTRVTITNEVIVSRHRNWQSITDNAQANTLDGFVVVCADGRVVCNENLLANSQGKKFNPSERNAQWASQDIMHAGCFSCGGFMSRFIILLPGQSLQLRSQIVDMQGREVLVWVVENPSEFAPLVAGDGGNPIFQLEFDGANASSVAIYYRSIVASYNPQDGMQGGYDVVMAPAVMTLRTDINRTILLKNLYQ